MALTVHSIDAETVASVLGEIADIASETLELQDVFGRIAASVRRVIPFEDMGVVRIIDGERVLLHATTMDTCADCFDPMPLSAWSPRWRPYPGPHPRIEDAPAELDPSFLMDAEVLKGGMGSGMWEPFRQGNEFVGGVWLCSHQTHAFDEEHQKVLRPIAALLGSAVEHWRIWDAERRRRKRLDRMETLLGTLAESLDVREVFGRLSAGMQAILPHNLIVMNEVDLRDRTIQIFAYAGESAVPVPMHKVPITEGELQVRDEFEIYQDIQTQIKPDTERQRLILSTGLRSWLRVPFFSSGEIKGSLSFFHQEPSRYSREDVEVARRLADRIAISLSLHRLAEGERVAAEAREKAERLEATVQTLARELESRDRNRIIGISSSWKETLLHVRRVAGSDTTVLITGESGTGKEVVSKLIHQGSPRSGRPFVAINCAALPEQLLESELFGYEKGAFTGANGMKIGRIEQAAGGTLFLDEIAEMSPLVQAKFLRVLEEREFQRLGGTRPLKADVRVVAATNRDLRAGISRQTFREDLFYRLNVFQIHVAPLRDRPQDILPLAESFLEDLGKSMGRPAGGISRDAREWLVSYSWPGNVRELRNAIERAILMCDGGLITREHLPVPAAFQSAASSFAASSFNGGSSRDLHSHENGTGSSLPTENVHLETAERALVEKALEQSRGNKSKAARLLGLSRAQLYWRLDKYGLH